MRVQSARTSAHATARRAMQVQGEPGPRARPEEERPRARGAGRGPRVAREGGRPAAREGGGGPAAARQVGCGRAVALDVIPTSASGSVFGDVWRSLTTRWIWCCLRDTPCLLPHSFGKSPTDLLGQTARWLWLRDTSLARVGCLTTEGHSRRQRAKERPRQHSRASTAEEGTKPMSSHLQQPALVLVQVLF